MKVIDKFKTSTQYVLVLENNKNILVNKEEYFANKIGDEIKLEAKVAYK